MRKYLMAVAFLSTSLFSATSFATDWSGPYIGAHAGRLEAGTDYTNPDTPSQNLDGAVFGAQAGYNFQTGNVVFGVETDASFGSLDDDVKDGNFLKYNGDLEAFGTIRGRIGYAFGNLLPYVTAGVAWARLEQGSSCPPGAPRFSVCAGFPAGFNVKSTETFWGWTAGGGVEWAFDKSWSLKAEALFGDFDDETYTATLPSIVGPVKISSPAELDFDSRLTVGINYHF